VPIYVYEVLTPEGQPTGRTVEQFQNMRDPHLSRLPTGEPCRRCVVQVNTGNREYGTGVESRVYHFHPSQVAHMRRELAQRGADPNVIRNDGTVVYRTQHDKTAFTRAHARFEDETIEKPKPRPAPKRLSNDEKRATVKSALEKLRYQKKKNTP
jgi:hypothetical protein